LALASAGQPIGAFIAGPAVIALLLAFGWRPAFIAIGSLGFVWAALWAIITREAPMTAASPSRSSQNRLGTPPERARVGKVLSVLIRNPPVVAVAVAYFGFAYTLYFFLTWFPTYLVKELHLRMTQMGIMSSIPWLFGLAGLIVGGFVANFLGRKRWGALLGRKIILVGGLTAAAFGVGLSGLVPTAAAAVGLMAAAAFFIYLTGVTYFGILQEVVSEELRGSAAGFVLVGASVAGIVAPAVTGGVIELTGHFTGAFIIAAGVALLGAATVALLVRTTGTDIPAASVG
jgi:sugar phosphate permease